MSNQNFLNHYMRGQEYMRIAGIDSGKQRDSFAFVGIEIKNDDSHVLGDKTR